MKTTATLLTLILLTVACSAQSQLTRQSSKPRLIVLADMGNEPDEMQQMVQSFMYSNMVDIEGLISVTSVHLQPSNTHPFRSVTHPELFHLLIDNSDKIIMKSVAVGEQLIFDASGSVDPDGDGLKYLWWIYPEADKNAYGKEFPIQNSNLAAIDFEVPKDTKGKELHLILEVWDDSKIVPLVDYRRVVLTVK
jgi:hypothetical protein